MSGATPRGQPWTPALALLHRRDGLSARRMAVLYTFREPSLGISFAVLDNPEPLYLLELLGQTAFFGTPWGTQEPPRYRFNWLNTQHVSDAEEKVMRIKTGGCASFDPAETHVEPFNIRPEKRETNG